MTTRLKTLAIASSLAFAAACGGPQPVIDDTEVVDTGPARPVEPVDTGPSEEELQAQAMDQARADFVRAGVLFNSRNRDSQAGEIERLLRRASEVNPEYRADALFNIGLLRQEAGDTAGAMEAYREATSARPGYARGLANIGYIQMEAGDYAAAEATFLQCIEVRETEPGCNVNLAVLLGMGQASPGASDVYEAMITRLRFALGGDARNADAFAYLAKLYFDDGRLELARLVCENAILLGIDEAVLHNRLGLIALEQDNVIEAYQEFQRAVALDEDLIAAWVNIGAMAMSFRDYEVALSAFERVLSEREDDVDVRLTYGAALRGVDRAEEAQAEYEAILSADSDHLGALYNMALLYQEAYQDYPGACGFYIQYLDAAPPSADRYEDAERRIFSLYSLLDSLAFLGEGAPEDALACQR